VKIFIFGIDGLGKESLEALGLTRLAKRLEKCVVGNPAIHNVVSRGWPEIYTGKTAYETGGFYQSPEVKNGRIYPTQKTGLSFIKKTINNDELLWNRLNAMGYSVGVFTVPTVTVPEKINGFCVRATGAGKFGNSLNPEDYYPSNLFDGFNTENVDLGLRMGYGALLPDTIEQLEGYASKHLDDYFRLLEGVLQRQPVDICFAASRFVNEMAYKFLGICLDEPKNDFEQDLRMTVRRLCAQFDEKLDVLIEQLTPEHFFLVSDHGLKRFNYELNLNQFLAEMGLIKTRSRFSHWKDLIRPLYFWAKRNLLKLKTGQVPPQYAFEQSTVFSIGFTNVLYLNDQRFGGRHYSEVEREKVLVELVQRLNASAEMQKLSDLISFEPLAKSSTDFVSPDILCKLSNGVANTERQFTVIYERDFAFKKMFSEGFYGEHSGCKADDTLVAYCGSQTGFVDFEKLTDVYTSILNVAKVNHD